MSTREGTDNVPRVSVIGSGRMGVALVRLLGAGAHEVVWAGRDLERIHRRAGELGMRGIQVLGIGEAIASSDIIVLALWHRHALQLAADYGNLLAGKIVVDIANPFTDDFTGFTTNETTSAAEELARALPETSVVGALKNTFWVVLEDPRFPEGDSDILVTGDHQDAKELVIRAFDGLPFRALDAGSLHNNRTIERMTLLSREIAIRYGHYPRVTWRLLGHDRIDETSNDATSMTPERVPDAGRSQAPGLTLQDATNRSRGR